MILYFAECSDTELDNIKLTIKNPRPGIVIHRGMGNRYNNDLAASMSKSDVFYILTNDETLLDRHEQFYSEKVNKWQVLIYIKDQWRDINTLTDKELHKSHLISRLFITGAFDQDDKEKNMNENKFNNTIGSGTYKSNSDISTAIGTTTIISDNSNCPHRLPCGLCRITNQQCPKSWNIGSPWLGGVPTTFTSDIKPSGDTCVTTSNPPKGDIHLY